jgi:hypothetical protein
MRHLYAVFVWEGRSPSLLSKLVIVLLGCGAVRRNRTSYSSMDQFAEKEPRQVPTGCRLLIGILMKTAERSGFQILLSTL